MWVEYSVGGIQCELVTHRDSVGVGGEWVVVQVVQTKVVLVACDAAIAGKTFVMVHSIHLPRRQQLFHPAPPTLEALDLW